MNIISDGQSALIKKIAIENHFEKFELCVKSGSGKGDNFMGIITNVSIRHDDRQLDLVMKNAHNSENADNTNVKSIYDTEIYVYETLFAELDKLQKELNIKHLFKGYPRIYGSSRVNTCLVMEDIRKKGFKLWDKKLPMNPEHITAVVIEYAKLHSLGMIMKLKKPELFVEISKTLVAPWIHFGEIMKDFDKGVVDKILRVIKSNKQATEAVEQFVCKLGEFNRLLEVPGYTTAFVHGDCWCNNMMFKYEEGSSSPIEVCLMDFQTTRSAMPASDLTHYLFCSLDKQELDNYKYYLNIYHSIVADNIASAGLNVEDIFPYSQLESQFKLSAFQGLMAASLVLQIILGENDEAPDIDGNMENVKKIFEMKIANQDEYERRILDLVMFMIKNDLFALKQLNI